MRKLRREEGRQLSGLRHGVVHEASGPELTEAVVDDLFHHRPAEALRDSAMELPVDHHGIDRLPAVVYRRVPQDAQFTGFHIHFYRRGLSSERPGYCLRIEIG